MKGPLSLALALQVILGLLLAQLHLSSRNSLENNGNWSATKAGLAVPVMGAQNFRFSRQALAGGHLNLGAWHGFQEAILERQIAPASVEFDFLLSRGGYLTFEFNRAGRRFDGIRLSANRGFPAMFLRVTPDGEFVRKKRVAKLRRIRANRWRRLGIVFGEGIVTVSLDGTELRNFDVAPSERQRIGFRAGAKPVFVDNIRIVGRDGAVFRENFRQPGNWLLINGVAAGGLPLLGLLLFVVLRRFSRSSVKVLLFYFLMFSGVLVVIAALVLGFSNYRSFLYPDPGERDRAAEAAWRDSAAETIFEGIERDYPAAQPAGTRRLLFLGSSQTWGSGALRRSETLVKQTESLLNERFSTVRFECINTAVSGYRLEDMARDFRDRWVAKQPHIAIVNATNNNIGYNVEMFERKLTEMAEQARAAGIDLVLVMEPNSVERRTPTLTKLHGIMARVGERYGLLVVDMQSYLEERYDDGFLWWDWVHLTSYGQRLFAERLVEALAEHGLVGLDRAPVSGDGPGPR